MQEPCCQIGIWIWSRVFCGVGNFYYLCEESSHKNVWITLPCTFMTQYCFTIKMLLSEKSVLKTLSTSSLIQPFYTIRATIFEKVFQPENFPQTEYFHTKRIIRLSSGTCKFSRRTCKLYFPL